MTYSTLQWNNMDDYIDDDDETIIFIITNKRTLKAKLVSQQSQPLQSPQFDDQNQSIGRIEKDLLRFMK